MTIKQRAESPERLNEMLLPFDKVKFPLTSDFIEKYVERNDEVDFVWFKSLVVAASMLFIEQLPTNDKIAFAVEIKELAKDMPDYVIQRVVDIWLKVSCCEDVGKIDNKKVVEFLSELCYAEKSKRLVDNKWRIIHNSGTNFRVEIFE